MCGRAGRKGKDDAGETYLICGKSDLEAVCDLLEADMPAIASCLAPEKRGLKRALLEAVATGLASGCEAIKEYVRCTLLCRTLEKKIAYNIMDSALKELVDEGLLRLKDDESYEATQLGQAVVASAFAPDDGLFVYEELKRALQAFVMDGDMHIFYMFTPLQAAATTQIDWQTFRDQLDFLDESGLRALQFVGVSPGFVNTMYFPRPTLRSFICATTSNDLQGTKRRNAQRNNPRTNQTRQNLPQSLHRLPTPRPQQRSSPLNHRTTLPHPTRDSPDPRAAMPRIRGGDGQILPAHGLGHARGGSGPYARSIRGWGACGSFGDGAGYVCEGVDGAVAEGEWVSEFEGVGAG